MKSFGCQEWPWVSYWRAQGLEWAGKLQESMLESRDAGFEAWEGTLPSDGAGLGELAAGLQQSGLSLPSLYANATLHDAGAAKNVEGLLARCRAAKALGFSVLVLNPEPIDWSKPLEKSDEQLARQAGALKELQLGLEAMGLRLAYHIHSSEMRSDGRELLAMFSKFPGLSLCMEAEWMLRGGWSPGRAQEFIAARAKSVASAHLRQCRNRSPLLGLEEGDVDYGAAAKSLAAAGFSGPVIFEGYSETRVGPGEFRASLKRSAVWMKANFAG